MTALYIAAWIIPGFAAAVYDWLDDFDLTPGAAVGLFLLGGFFGPLTVFVVLIKYVLVPILSRPRPHVLIRRRLPR